MSLQKRSRLFFMAGFVFMALTLLPCLLLGQNAVFTYHDQLDGEVIAYLLRAKHLGDGSVVPEFMGGASKTALIPPAPGAVLLFKILDPFTALFLMQAAGILIGYSGMYLLVKESAKSDPAALAAGVLYGMIPFLPVYGLSQYGLPLLFWCILRLKKNTDGRFFAFCYAMMYALNSSLVLAGFAVLVTVAVWLLADWRKRKRFPGNMGAFLGGLVGIYFLTNLRLIAQVLGIGESEVSHKTEYVLVPEKILRGFGDAFLHGGQHSTDRHMGILGLAVVVLLLERIRRRMSGNEDVKSESGSGRGVWLCLVCNLAFAAVSALWNSSLGIEMRGHMGAAGAFQMDRFLWLAPCFWYLILGYSVARIFAWLRADRRLSRHRKTVRENVQKVCTIGAMCVCVVVLGGTSLALLKDSDLKSNLQKLRNPDYPILSYNDYYAVGVLEQIRDYLWQEKGMAQEEYHVVSLGIDPAAALYHGFYCLDGYSNNYALAYKHAFRRVIAPALEKSEYLREYFDHWGNRCYLFGTESPGYYTIEKNGFYFNHLELDTKALAELGGDYLFSAAYIANSEELGLRLMREEPFETQDSYYRIFLYEVADETE